MSGYAQGRRTGVQANSLNADVTFGEQIQTDVL